MPPLLQRLTHSATVRILVALAVGAGAYLLPSNPDDRLVLAWDAFCVTLLAIVLVTFSTVKPSQIRKVATEEDVSRPLIFMLVLVGAGVSLFALVRNLHPYMGAFDYELPIRLLAVALSWALVHATFTFRYAHLYYGTRQPAGGSADGGIVFGGEAAPDYWDFAYLSFTIGMTAQVSDTSLTRPAMRRLVLLHGLISFLFNTVIIALTISVVSQMVH